jgi:cytochrome c oxidase subunit 2
MRRRPAAATALPLLLTGCEGAQAVLAPAGYAAERIAGLWWLMFALGSAVWLVVVGLAVYVFFLKRAEDSDRPIAQRTEGDHRRARWVVGGVAASLLILVTVFISSLLTGRSIQAMATPQPLTIEVIGHQWWWEVRYQDPDPSQRFEAANELHIPVGQPVRIQLRSEDVLHSFWVPSLTGKTDLVPGRTNTLWVHADEPGVYRGQCAEFCGLQHAKMAFMVVAHPPAEYEAWAAGQLAPARTAAAPLARRGEQVFLSRGCVLCHAVRGTPARGDVGPDLTHFGSRLTIAAGILPNTRGHLGGWISNPQVIKPGNRMPRVPLDSEELQALLAYLESLQ